MERYYDLIIANTIRENLTFNGEYSDDLGLMGTAPEGTSESERWEIAKKAFWHTKYGVISEWGLIDFDPKTKANLVGGENLSYREYIELQKRSGRHVKQSLEQFYYDACYYTFMGQITDINHANDQVLFDKLIIDAIYMDGSCTTAIEEHISIPVQGFERYQKGDGVRFAADIYRYITKDNMIDYGLKCFSEVRPMPVAEIPTEEDIKRQKIEDIICKELCMYRDRCYGNCIADSDWYESMKQYLMGK